MGTDGPQTGGLRATLNRCFHSTFCMVMVALALRLAVMGFLYTEQLNPERDHWRFAYENGRLARSIVEGRGLSSPLFADTGVSAWMTPVYPYLVAGAFRIFGVYSVASDFALLTFQALVSALNCLPIFYFARRLFGLRVGLWSGWTWAFFPYAIYFPVERIWGTWLSTLMLSILFLIALHMEKSPRLWLWAGFGMIWGFTALIEPVVMTAWPFVVCWSAFCLFRQRARWFAPLAVSVLGLLLVVTPWFVRNYSTFGRFIPFRDTMGMEIHMGNSGDTFHWRPSWIGPWHNDQEWKDFRELGEVAYMQREKQRGLDFIRSHPKWFAVVTVRRFGYIWTGFWSLNKRYLAEEPFDPPNILMCTALTVMMLFGLRRLWRQDWPRAVYFASVLFFFPAVFYVTHVEVYYRRQIDPLIVILAVLAFLPIEKAPSEQKGSL